VALLLRFFLVVGLLSGILTAAVHHGLTQPRNAISLVKGGWLGSVVHVYPSEMAQNFWTAIFAWTACFVITIIVSLLTQRNKTDEQLTGLVSSLTPRRDLGEIAWYARPLSVGVLVLILVLILDIVFW
jgi:SSS family solute:Na+ symporter